MKSIIPGRVGFAITLTLALGVMASGAWAQSTSGQRASCGGSASLGDMFCSFQNSTIAQLVVLIFGIAFIGGIYLFWKGVQQLIKVNDSQGQQSLGSALLPMAAGAFLIALPATIAVGLGTLYGDHSGWDFEAQDKGGDANLPVDDILSMIGNFAINAAGPLSTLVMGIAVVIGIALVATSMFGLAKMADHSSQPEKFSAVAAKFFIGICLVNVFWIMNAIGASFGLTNLSSDALIDITGSALGYANAAMKSEDVGVRFQNIINIAFMALIPFGLIAFVRGLLIVKDSASGTQQSNYGGGATHIVGGIALVNAKTVSCAIMATLAGGANFCPTT